jgi:hypothetical protein
VFKAESSGCRTNGAGEKFGLKTQKPLALTPNWMLIKPLFPILLKKTPAVMRGDYETAWESD